MTIAFSFRKYNKLKLKKVCSKLGLSKKKYLAIEKGMFPIKPKLRIELAKLYNVPVEVFQPSPVVIYYMFNTFDGSNAYVHNLTERGRRKTT